MQRQEARHGHARGIGAERPCGGCHSIATSQAATVHMATMQ